MDYEKKIKSFVESTFWFIGCFEIYDWLGRKKYVKKSTFFEEPWNQPETYLSVVVCLLGKLKKWKKKPQLIIAGSKVLQEILLFSLHEWLADFNFFVACIQSH